jgi:hypothetical protein
VTHLWCEWVVNECDGLLSEWSGQRQRGLSSLPKSAPAQPWNYWPEGEHQVSILPVCRPAAPPLWQMPEFSQMLSVNWPLLCVCAGSPWRLPCLPVRWPLLFYSTGLMRTHCVIEPCSSFRVCFISDKNQKLYSRTRVFVTESGAGVLFCYLVVFCRRSHYFDCISTT